MNTKKIANELIKIAKSITSGTAMRAAKVEDYMEKILSPLLGEGYNSIEVDFDLRKYTTVISDMFEDRSVGLFPTGPIVLLEWDWSDSLNTYGIKKWKWLDKEIEPDIKREYIKVLKKYEKDFGDKIAMFNM